MRLSEVKGERCLDVLADVIGPVVNMAQDPELKRAVSGDGPQSLRVAKAAPAIIKGHKDDIVAILAAVEGVDPAEYEAAMTMPGLVKAAYDLLTDEELLAFLS